MSENALTSKGELGRYSTSPNPKFTRHAMRAGQWNFTPLYTATAWDPYTARNIQQLEAVQRRVTRFFTDYKTTTGLKLRERNKNLIFLFLNQNICCWYSKELSQVRPSRPIRLNSYRDT